MVSVPSPPRALQLLQRKPTVAANVLLDGPTQPLRQLHPDQQENSDNGLLSDGRISHLPPPTESCLLIGQRGRQQFSSGATSCERLRALPVCQFNKVRSKRAGNFNEGLTGVVWFSDE